MPKIATLLAPYSLAVSLLYLSGFWGTFNVNVLEYIALSDVVKNAIVPLLYSSFFILAGITTGNVFILPIEKIMPPGGGADLPEAKYIRWFFNLMALLIFVVALYQIFFEVGNYRWFKVACLAFILLILFVGEASFAEQYIKQKHLRVIVVNSLTAILLFSFGWGAINAQEAKSSEQTLKINNVISKHIYLGWAGDYLFLWNKKEESVVTMFKSTVKQIERSIPKEKPIIDLSKYK